MPRALWKNAVIAESTTFETVENNVYFPPGTAKMEYLHASATHTTCPWKGVASYYDVIVDGHLNKDAAWCYTNPKDAAKNIKDHIAFWKGVTVEAGR